MTHHSFDRRTFIKGAGVAAGAALVGTTAGKIDDGLDLDGGVQEVVVVFEEGADADVLGQFDLPDGYHAFEVLPFAYARATGEQIRRIADLETVRYVQENAELEPHNDDGRALTGAEVVHEELGVTGEGVHAVVIDTGFTTHPDLQPDLEHNYHFQNPLETDDDQMWVDVGNADIDDVGHGSHVAGSLGGTGEMSDGEYRGTAPDAKLTGYKTNIGGALYVIYVLAAIEDVLRKQRDGELDVHIVNNSFGLSNDGDFNPLQAVHYAYWKAFEAGIVPVFSAGNSGPDHGTLNYLGKQPYSLCVAATHTGDEGPPKATTDFSSRGRPPVADADLSYTDDYDYGLYEDNEGPNYDRRTALENVRALHRSGQDEAPEVDADYEDQFGVTVPTTLTDPTAWTSALGLDGQVATGGPVYHEWDSPTDAGSLEATFDVGPVDRESVYVQLYRGDQSDVEDDEAVIVARDGNVIRDGPLEFDVPIREDTTYTFEFYGFNNVETEVTAHLTARERVSRPDGPFGMYRCDVGAPGNLITSTAKTTEVLGALGETDGDPFYADVSGTSMSCPLTAGCVALVLDAYRQEAGYLPKPIDAINIMEATAEGGTGAELGDHTEANMGAGFVDAAAAVELARELGATAARRGPPERADEARGGPDDPGQGGGQPDDVPPGGAGPSGDDPTVPDHPELWDEIELCSYLEREPPACVDHVDSASFSGQLLAGAGSPAVHETTTETFGTDELSSADLPGNLMDVSISVSGPPGYEWTEVDVEHQRDGEWVRIGTQRFEAAEGTFRLVDGWNHGGEELAVVADGETYRLRIRAATTYDVVVTFEAEAQFGAYDTEPC